MGRCTEQMCQFSLAPSMATHLDRAKIAGIGFMIPRFQKRDRHGELDDSLIRQETGFV